MTIQEAIRVLDKHIANPREGLPEEVFLFLSRLTPMVNVDLLIKDKDNRVLLAWRNDQYVGAGWHIPGGIVRFQEDLDTRIQKVAKSEINATVEYLKEPIAINQIVCREQSDRSHFISLLYQCFVSNEFIPDNTGLSATDVGFLKWHNTCPDNLISVHEIYRKHVS